MIKIADFYLATLREEVAVSRDYYYEELLETREPEFLIVGGHSTKRVPVSELRQLDDELKAVWEHIVRLRRMLLDSGTAQATAGKQ